MNFEALIGDSFFFIYLFAVISVITFETFNTKQKISIIYIFTYGISFNSQLDKKILLVCMIFTLFIFEEYLNTSEIIKKDFFYRISYKVLDFLYLYVFRYKMLIICMAIGIRGYTFNRILLYIFPECINSYILDYGFSITTALSTILLCLGIHFMLTDYVQIHTFEEVFNIFKQYPYYECPLSNPIKREQLCRRMELIVDIEDRTFFVRRDSYHFWSFENVKAIWNTKKRKKGVSEYTNNSGRVRRLFAKIIRNIHKILRPNKYDILKKRKNIKFLLDNLKYFIINSYSKCRNTSKRIVKYLLRGHSTIEMQLIRILFYERGLLLGNPLVRDDNKKIRIKDTLYKFYCMIERKCFEVIYSTIVFASLKHYLGISHITNLDYFRYYIVYIYLHVVQTNVNGKKYRPVNDYFEGEDVSKWSMEKMFVAALGLCSRPITPKRIKIYDFIIIKYDLDVAEINRLCGI